MTEEKKPRLIGINHVAIEVGNIDEALEWYGRIFDFKLRVERVLCRGPSHPAARARFGVRAAMLAGLPLGVAATRAERFIPRCRSGEKASFRRVPARLALRTPSSFSACALAARYSVCRPYFLLRRSTTPRMPS